MHRRTPWTSQERDELVEWHEGILALNRYPKEIKDELRQIRLKFIAGIRIKR